MLVRSDEIKSVEKLYIVYLGGVFFIIYLFIYLFIYLLV